MKKLLILSLILSSTVLFSQTKIRITNGEWEPYFSEQSHEYGLGSHIVTEAFKLEGIEVEYGFFPWARSLESTRSGDWDAAALWWPAEGYNKDFLISEPVIASSFVFFHLKSSNFDWNTIKDLKNIDIGFTRGYDYGIDFMTALESGDISVDEASTDEANFKKLLAKRLDVFPNDPVVGFAQLRNLFTPEEVKLFTYHEKPLDISNLHLLISKKGTNSDYFLEKFNSGLKKLKDSGRLDKMYKDLDDGLYDTKK